MRVLHIITGLRRAGAETMLVKLGGALAHAGFDNHVVCLIDRGAMADELEAIGIPVTALGQRATLDPRPLWRLIALLRRLEPDIIQTWLYHADLAGLVAAMLVGRRNRLIWNIRCSEMDFSDDPAGSSGRLLRLLARFSRVPAGVVVNSHAGRLYHERLGYRPRWWLEIPNGFDLAHWQPDRAADSRLRAALGLAPDALVVGMVARVAPMKDHGNFLAAFAQVATEVPRAHAVLVGRGTETLATRVRESNLEGKVTLLGERDDVAQLVPGFDLFCLSSAFGEGFANALGEAMACAVPCVATDVGDAAAIIGDTGCIVPPRAPAALAAAMVEMLNAPPAQRRQWGAAARCRIEERYGLAAVARHYADAYAAVASGAAPT